MHRWCSVVPGVVSSVLRQAPIADRGCLEYHDRRWSGRYDTTYKRSNLDLAISMRPAYYSCLVSTEESLLRPDNDVPLKPEVAIVASSHPPLPIIVCPGHNDLLEHHWITGAHFLDDNVQSSVLVIRYERSLCPLLSYGIRICPKLLKSRIICVPRDCLECGLA
jgi:hypothetical protein